MKNRQLVIYAVIDILYTVPVALNINDLHFHLACRGIVVSSEWIRRVCEELALQGQITRAKRPGVRLPFYYYDVQPPLPGIEEKPSQ